jgi:Fic family protein
LNVLYLTHAGLLETPILYLSRHITRTKADYYRLIQAVRTQGAWEDWILYMLEAVADTAQTTLGLVEGIRNQMANGKKRLRDELPNLYSQDLLNNLFRHPYTRIEFVVKDLKVSRQTAAKYLDILAEKGFVAKHRSGRSNYYVNTDLVRLFLDVSGG